jgi:hypothetical protein
MGDVLPSAFEGSLVYFGGLPGMRESSEEAECWQLASDSDQAQCKGHYHGEYWAINGAVSDNRMKIGDKWIWSYETGFDDFSFTSKDYAYTQNSNDWVS